MGHCVRFPDVPYPLIKGKIMMSRRAERRVVYLCRIFAKSSGRLNCNEDISVHGPRHHQLSAIFHNAARGTSPVFGELVLYFLFKLTVKRSVFFPGNLVGFFQLLCRKHGAVIGCVADKYFNKLSGILRNKINFIPAFFHIGQQKPHAFNSI